jgi:hypothetical protein
MFLICGSRESRFNIIDKFKSSEGAAKGRLFESNGFTIMDVLIIYNLFQQLQHYF